mmetsp:Transcript_104369/g.196437  ORF Transcript_104369/g.196437 Transcript_104369/m.196437 type:complete len:703 (-) Transcript_104369:81-2189(-)
MSTYAFGYAPTSASTCKGKCKMKLVKGTLRLGVSGDGPGDYTVTSYRCLDCVTDKQIANIKAKVGDLSNVDGFDTLTPADQKKVLAKDGGEASTAKSPKAKAKGKAKAEAAEPTPAKAGRAPPKAEAKATRSKPPPSEKDQHAFLDKAKHFDFDAVKALVEETPELVNCQPAGRWSALHQFAQGGNVEAVKWLLEHGADRNVKTKDGKTPIEVADVACKVPLEEPPAPPPSRAKARDSKEDEEMEDEEEEAAEEEEKPASGKRKAAESASSSSSAPPAKKAKGAKPVDGTVPNRENYAVVDDWSVLLNQTNVGANNNKFYKIQVLKKSSGEYFCWQHWGRVGAKGQDKLEAFGKGGLSGAETCFQKKFKDKTGVAYTMASTYDWTPKMGKYTLVETDDQEGADAEGSAPLGKLTPHQIEKGQGVLEKLDLALDKKKKDSTELNNLSSEYYTLIPHNFGFSIPPAINTKDMLEAEQELLKFYLRMGFEETGSDATLSPIEGIMDMDLPKSLQEAAGKLCAATHIKSSEAKGATHAEKQTGSPNTKMEAHLYGAIMLYTSNAIYKDLNAVLRSEDRSKIKKYFLYLRLLLEAFARLPQQTKTLWRGVSVDLHDQYKPGSTITWWGVSSCTADQNVAKNFMKGCGGKCTLLTVKTKTAADISQITFFGNEKENLLAPGTQLQVISSKRVDKVTEIQLEEVGRGLG